MPRALDDFTTCAPGTDEATIFGMDFALDLAPAVVVAGVIVTAAETITSVTFTCEVAESSTVDDSGAATRLTGDPTINGTIVTQLGTNFVAGVTYRIKAVIYTSQGQIIPGWANTTCEAIAS